MEDLRPPCYHFLVDLERAPKGADEFFRYATALIGRHAPADEDALAQYQSDLQVLFPAACRGRFGSLPQVEECALSCITAALTILGQSKH